MSLRNYFWTYRRRFLIKSSFIPIFVVFSGSEVFDANFAAHLLAELSLVPIKTI